MILNTVDQNEDRTFSELVNDDGSVQCVVLELPWRNNHPSTSCIPAGVYVAHLRWSHRHGYALYWVDRVTGRQAAEFHVGNTVPKDSEGCLLVGTERGTLEVEGVTLDAVLHSRTALDVFMTSRGAFAYRELTSDKMVSDFLLEHPEASSFGLDIRNRPAA